MYHAGELRDRLLMYTRVPFQNELGEADYTYKPAKTVFARVAPSGGRTEDMQGESERFSVTHRIVVREKSVRGLAADTYFVHRGQRLKVQYWYPIYAQRGWMEIFCEAVTEDGQRRARSI